MFNYFVKKRKKKGFTLVELLVVVAIVAVLAVVAVPRLTSATEGAKLSAMESNMDTLKAAIVLYAADHGGQMPTQTDLRELENYISEPTGNNVIDYFNGRPQGSTYVWTPSTKTLVATLTGIKNASNFKGASRAGEWDASDNYIITYKA